MSNQEQIIIIDRVVEVVSVEDQPISVVSVGTQGPPGISGPPGAQGPPGTSVYAIRTLTSGNQTVSSSDGLLICDSSGGDTNITLPLASSLPGRLFKFKKIDSSSNNVNLLRSGSDLIDGDISFSFNQQLDMFELISSGSEWLVG